MLVRNGELIKPYGIVEFDHLRTVSWYELNHIIAFYKEESRTGFDPTGCVLINYFNIDREPIERSTCFARCAHSWRFDGREGEEWWGQSQGFTGSKNSLRWTYPSQSS